MFGFWYVVIALAAIIVLCTILGGISIWRENGAVLGVCGGIAIAAFIAFIIFLLLATFMPIAAANTANIYANMYTTYQGYASLIQKEGFGALNNAEIGKKIIEYNEWLASALASKETYGCFSEYLHVDLSSFQFIDIAFGG